MPDAAYGDVTIPAGECSGKHLTIKASAASSFASVDSLASQVVLDGFRVLSDQSGISIRPEVQTVPLQLEDVTLRNFKAGGLYILGNYVTVTDGEVGPFDSCAGKSGPWGVEDGILISGRSDDSGYHVPSKHITIGPRVSIHDVFRTDCDNHTDGIQAFGFDYLTIRGVRMWNVATSYLIGYTFHDDTVVDHLLVEDSQFGPVTLGGHGFSTGRTCASCNGTDSIVIRHNTFYSGPKQTTTAAR